MKGKFKYIVAIVVLALILAGTFLVLKPKVIQVEIAKVLRGSFTEEILSDGYFRAKKRYTVTAFAEGDIKRVDFKVGDVLKKNQAITELFWDVEYVPVKSPINGVITKIFHESAGPIHRGEAIVEVVDPSELEIVAELLTTDAARIKAGSPVMATGWGDNKEIRATVNKISKAGFVKISALGVEEERTEVIMEPEDLLSETKKKLGHTFHTQLSIQVSKLDSVLKIPTGAIMRQGSGWAVYQVIDGVAHLKSINLLLHGNEEAVIAEGLKEGDLVINYPSDKIKEGTLVTANPVRIKKK